MTDVVNFIKDNDDISADTYIPVTTSLTMSNRNNPIRCGFIHMEPECCANSEYEDWDETREVNKFLTSCIISFKPIRGCAVIIPQSILDYDAIVAIVNQYVQLDTCFSRKYK